MQILRQGLLGLAVIAGLVANQFTASAQQISGPTCINYAAPAVPNDPNPPQTRYTYTFTPLNPSDVFVGWGKKGDVEIVNTSGTATASSYTATVESTGYGRGEVRAYYSVGGCAPAEVRYRVNKIFDKLDNSKLTGPDCVQGGGTYAFTVPPIVSSAAQIAEQIGVDSYYWSGFPSGSIVNKSGDESAVTVTLPPNFQDSFTLEVIIGECNSANTAKKMTKIIGSRASTPTITPATGVISCKNDLSAFTLSYNVQANVNYLWRIPSGWQISPAGANVGTGISYNSPGLQTVTITPSNTNADNISVTASFPNATNCGASVVTSNIIQVTYQLTAANTINISNTSPCLTPGSSVNLSVGGTSSNTSIQWSLPPGWMITSSTPNDNTIMVTVGTASGTITASAVNCPGTISRTVAVSGDNGCTYNYAAVGCGALQLTSGVSSCLPVYNASTNPGVWYTFSSPNNPPVRQRGRTYVPDNGLTNETVTVKIENTSPGSCFEANFTIGPVTLAPCARPTSVGSSKPKEAVQVYPNPTAGRLNVDLPVRAGEASKLVLTDVAGRQQLLTTTKEARTSLDVSKLPQGVYTLRAELPNGKVLTQKVIINRDAPAATVR